MDGDARRGSRRAGCWSRARATSWAGAAAGSPSTPTGPRTLTLACRPADLERPSDLAERLPKALIHRNVPGERVHALLAALDRCWARAAPFATFGPRARWTEAVALLARRLAGAATRRRRWRLGEVTLDWAAVTPS